MTESNAEDVLREMGRAFGLGEEQVALAFAAAGLFIDQQSKARSRVADVFAGKLTPGEAARAADAGIAILAAGLTDEQLEAGRKLTGIAIRADGRWA